MQADLERVVRVLKMVECRKGVRGGLEARVSELSILDRKDLCCVSGDGCVGLGECPTVCCKSRIVSYAVPADDSATAI
jgi:hypothetical protein